MGVSCRGENIQTMCGARVHYRCAPSFFEWLIVAVLNTLWTRNALHNEPVANMSDVPPLPTDVFEQCIESVTTPMLGF